MEKRIIAISIPVLFMNKDTDRKYVCVFIYVFHNSEHHNFARFTSDFAFSFWLSLNKIFSDFGHVVGKGFLFEIQEMKFSTMENIWKTYFFGFKFCQWETFHCTHCVFVHISVYYFKLVITCLLTLLTGYMFSLRNLSF